MRLRRREASFRGDWKSLDFLDSLRIELFQGLTREVRRNLFFVGVRRLDVRLAAGGREIVADAVNLVEEALPLFRPVPIFRPDRLLTLVEPIDHLDERGD